MNRTNPLSHLAASDPATVRPALAELLDDAALWRKRLRDRRAELRAIRDRSRRVCATSEAALRAARLASERLSARIGGFDAVRDRDDR